MKILVSACLLGEKCKYDGGSNFNETVAAFCRGKEVIAVCPEISSGMGSPRVPAEIVNGKVTDKNGIKGAGIFAEALMKKGISVMDEEELERNFFLKHKEEL